MHFERCMRALAIRKETLLNEAESKLQLHSTYFTLLNNFVCYLPFYVEKIIESQQKEVNDSISGCQRILEGGALLYSTNKDVATAIWKVFSLSL